MNVIISTSILLDVAPAMFEHPGARPKHIGGASMFGILPQKRCPQCGETDLSKFNKSGSSKDGYQSWCKSCQRKKTNEFKRNYYQENRELVRARQKEYYQKNAAKMRAYSKKYGDKLDPEIKLDRHLRSLYGMTAVQYKEMLAQQGGVCLICGGVNKNGKRLYVDHDHETGVIRGLLCSTCNTAIGHLSENVGLLQKAIEYLKKWTK